MGVHFNFNLSSDSKFNQYRKDVEKIKNVIEIRMNDPVYWYKVTHPNNCENVMRWNVQQKTGRITVRLGLSQII